MAKLEIQLPDRIDSEITRLVEDGEFMNREQAIEELLSRGVSAYDTADPTEEEPYEDWGMGAAEGQGDPSLRGDDPDDRTF